jgi:hypothetical protein
MDLGLALYETYQIHTSGKPVGLCTCHLDRIHLLCSVVTPYRHIYTNESIQFHLNNHRIIHYIISAWIPPGPMEALGEACGPL